MDILAMLNRVEVLLKAQGRTKTQLYAACEVTASAVSQWKSGRTTPYPKTLQRIADYLGVSYEYLITGLGEKEKAPTSGGERKPTDDEIKFALFGGGEDITDAMYDEVKRFAAYVKERDKKV